MSQSQNNYQWYLKDTLPVSSISVVPKGHITNRQHNIFIFRHNISTKFTQWYLKGKKYLLFNMVVLNGKKELNSIIYTLNNLAIQKFPQIVYSPITFSANFQQLRNY